MPRFREATTSPEVGEMVRVWSEFETEVTTPEAPASAPQVMLPAESVSRTEAVLQFKIVPKFKPPAVIFRPFVKVEVAVPVVLIAKTFTPMKVEEAVVDVALKYGAPIRVPDSIPPLYVVVPVVVNRLRPEKVLESARSVDEAKAQVEVEYEYRRPEPVTPTPPALRAPIVREPLNNPLPATES